MRIAKIALILLITIVPQAVLAKISENHAAEPSEINALRSSDNGFRLILKSHRSSTVSAGQEELMAKAAELCAPRRASFGKYAFELAEPVGGLKAKPMVLMLRQDIECGVGPSEGLLPAQTVPAPRMATQDQVQRVEQQTRLYFEAKDQGRYAGAYDMMAASLKKGITFETWKEQATVFNAKAGAVEQRIISKITWYHNPPQVEPGFYAAVDFSSKFAEVDLHCGFLAWREQLDGTFLLVREEENYLDKQTQQKLEPSDLEKIRQQFKCR